MDGGELPPLPEGPCFAACSFAVVQCDKVRRCEDFRRSAHNMTVRAADSPLHHDIEVYLQAIRFAFGMGCTPLVWGHDLQAAYRQLPVSQPGHCVSLLMTPSGPSIWRHRALPFGAIGSVWGFNRVADGVVALSRKILLNMVHHYVDDFGAIEDRMTASSSFTSFEQGMATLGFRMKQKKAQPPEARQKLLGVYLDIQDDVVMVVPCPERVKKMVATLQRALDTDHLDPDTARRVTGKLNFIASTLFNNLGKALLRPLYGRAHETHTKESNLHHLNSGLRTAIHTLMSLLANIQPRAVPLRARQPVCGGDLQRCLLQPKYQHHTCFQWMGFRREG